MITVRDSYMLAHPTDRSVGYSFAPMEGGALVRITHTTKHTCDAYQTTVEEARRFYRQLLRTGYMRF